MPLPSSAVGRTLPARRTIIDTRWVMSYAAGIGQGDCIPCYMDTAQTGSATYCETHDFHIGGMQGSGVIAHPVFIWAVEWQIFWRGMGPLFEPRAGQAGLLSEEGLRSVHYSEDIIIHRPIVAGDVLDTITRLASVGSKPKGSSCIVQCESFDSRNEKVVTAWSGFYYRGTQVEGEPSFAEQLLPPPVPPVPDTRNCLTFELQVSAVEAHVYSECARIWNPIHTDRAAALRAGLPDIILHGTAILARVVSKLTSIFLEKNPKRIRRVVAGAFGAPVLMPSAITLNVLSSQPDGIWFEVLNADGHHAIRNGFLGLDGSGIDEPRARL